MPAPKGNKFALGNSGRSKQWKDAKELQKDIDAYFEECDSNEITKDRNGKPITEPYTIEGLAMTLDCTRETLLNYEKTKGYEEFFSTIKKAKTKIQRQKVVNGMTGMSNPAITIFDLKNNHGYKDKQEIDQNIKSDQPIFNLNPLEDKQE